MKIFIYQFENKDQWNEILKILDESEKKYKIVGKGSRRRIEVKAGRTLRNKLDEIARYWF